MLIFKGGGSVWGLGDKYWGRGTLWGLVVLGDRFGSGGVRSFETYIEDVNIIGGRGPGQRLGMLIVWE